jgi:hypothetical protein
MDFPISLCAYKVPVMIKTTIYENGEGNCISISRIPAEGKLSKEEMC